MYNKKIMEIFQNPKNMGEIRKADAVGVASNSTCGDIMKLYLQIEDGKIVDAKFKTFGCVATIATSSVATQFIKGLTMEEAVAFDTQKLLDELGELPPQKTYCLKLVTDAIKDAADNFNKKQEKEEERKRKEIVE